MQRRVLRVSTVALSGLVFFATNRAEAAPPGDWSIAIERVFGIDRVKDEIETAPGQQTTTESTSVSLGSESGAGFRGYSAARLAIDYLVASGLTLGGALGYQSVNIGDDDDDDADWWLLMGRIGYLASIGDGVGIWPRGGLTHTSFDARGASVTATAISVEAPLIIYALGRRVGFEIMPHADIGIAGGTGNLDRTLTEFGLQFNLGAFF